jgi:hypothetical protein
MEKMLPSENYFFYWLGFIFLFFIYWLYIFLWFTKKNPHKFFEDVLLEYGFFATFFSFFLALFWYKTLVLFVLLLIIYKTGEKA